MATLPAGYPGAFSGQDEDGRPQVNLGEQVHGTDTFTLHFSDTVGGRQEKQLACKKLVC